jgi:hypothetical protein
VAGVGVAGSIRRRRRGDPRLPFSGPRLRVAKRRLTRRDRLLRCVHLRRDHPCCRPGRHGGRGSEWRTRLRPSADRWVTIAERCSGEPWPGSVVFAGPTPVPWRSALILTGAGGRRSENIVPTHPPAATFSLGQTSVRAAWTTCGALANQRCMPHAMRRGAPSAHGARSAHRGPGCLAVCPCSPWAVTERDEHPDDDTAARQGDDDDGDDNDAD